MEQSGQNPAPSTNQTAARTVQQAHSDLTQAVNTLSPAQFQQATAGAVSNLPNDQLTALLSALENSGAPQGANVQAGATDANSISKMLHWVQTNVPGGIPAVVAAVGVAGAAAAKTDQAGNVEAAAGNVASTAGNVASAAEHAGGGLLNSVLGSIMPAINEAVSKIKQ